MNGTVYIAIYTSKTRPPSLLIVWTHTAGVTQLPMYIDETKEEEEKEETHHFLIINIGTEQHQHQRDQRPYIHSIQT